MPTIYDQSNITTYRGDEFAFDVMFKDTSDAELPINVTGWTLYWTIKVHRNDPDEGCAYKNEYQNLVNPETGIITVSMTHQETDLLKGTYFFCVQVKKLDGTIQTITRGGISFLTDVTRRIS